MEELENNLLVNKTTREPENTAVGPLTLFMSHQNNLITLPKFQKCYISTSVNCEQPKMYTVPSMLLRQKHLGRST